MGRAILHQPGPVRAEGSPSFALCPMTSRRPGAGSAPAVLDRPSRAAKARGLGLVRLTRTVVCRVGCAVLLASAQTRREIKRSGFRRQQCLFRHPCRRRKHSGQPGIGGAVGLSGAHQGQGYQADADGRVRAGLDLTTSGGQRVGGFRGLGKKGRRPLSEKRDFPAEAGILNRDGHSDVPARHG